MKTRPHTMIAWTLAILLGVSPSLPAMEPLCVGDGDSSGAVSIGEVQQCVDSFLGDCRRFHDNGDGTVTDRKTGLIWAKTTDDAGIRDKDSLYTWSADGTAPNGTAFTTFLAGLNEGITGIGNCTSGNGLSETGGFAGHCDWRLATIGELRTLLLATYPCPSEPCTDPNLGPTKPTDYWSATTLAGTPANAWVAHLGSGLIGTSVKTATAAVRAVRGRDTSVDTAARFRGPMTDGVVIDTQTTLLWEQKTNDGSIHDTDDTYPWTSTSSAADGPAFTTFLATLNGGHTGVGNCVSADGSTQSGGFLGHCDWRLPTIVEFNTILDLGVAGCAEGVACIDPVFTDTQPYFYWTSTTYDTTPTSAWFADFDDGDSFRFTKANTFYVRAVRGGR